MINNVLFQFLHIFIKLQTIGMNLGYYFLLLFINYSQTIIASICALDSKNIPKNGKVKVCVCVRACKRLFMCNISQCPSFSVLW